MGIKGRFMMNNKGVTMIELLIVVAIFSLILTGLTIAFIQQQRLSNFTQEAIDVDQTGRTALDYIASIVRNAAARQGKTFSMSFENGGSTADPTRCEDNTGDDAGSVDNTPDCLTIFTWDITKGEYVDPVTNERKFPSIAASVTVASAGPPLVLQLPEKWFKDDSGNPLAQPLLEAGDLLGFRSRIILCTPDSTVSCVATPHLCTECAAILRVDSVDSATQQATIDNVDDIIEQNFQELDFAVDEMATFINNFFLPVINTYSNEMTIVQAQTFTIDPADRQLLLRQNEAGNFQPIAGPLDANSPDASGIVDLQFVFNLQRADGGMTKVGVPLDAANCRFPNFDELENEIGLDPNTPCRSGEKDIRTIEIYLLVRSRVRPTLVQGKFTPLQSVPAIGDVLERDTNHASLGEGFMYRLFSTVVYIRNMAREEFG